MVTKHLASSRLEVNIEQSAISQMARQSVCAALPDL